MKKELRQKIRKIYGEMLKINEFPHVYSMSISEEIFNYLTPIENNIWSDIRRFGLPMYPQFPVKGYFIDFADPIKKIGIEVDSKQWHKDIKKDELRIKDIESEGWKIYIIQGKDTFIDSVDCFEECDCEIYEEGDECTHKKQYKNSSEYKLKLIYQAHYDSNPVSKSNAI